MLVTQRAFDDALDDAAARQAFLEAAADDVSMLRDAIERFGGAHDDDALDVRRSLAACYADAGDTLQAEAQYDFILSAAPSDRQALAFLKADGPNRERHLQRAGRRGRVRHRAGRARPVRSAAPAARFRLEALAEAIAQHREATPDVDALLLSEEATLRSGLGQAEAAQSLRARGRRRARRRFRRALAEHHRAEGRRRTPQRRSRPRPNVTCRSCSTPSRPGRMRASWTARALMPSRPPLSASSCAPPRRGGGAARRAGHLG